MNKKTASIVLEKVKILLDMEDTCEYDSKLEILISAAVNTLKSSGIPFLDESSEMFSNYCICIAMETAKLMDMDFNFENLQRIYVTAVNSLRMEFNEKSM